MPHVSKHRVEKDIYENIFSNFIDIFATLKNKKESNLLINDLLTKTERLMLAKRLGIIFLLEEGVSGYVICKMLKVSQSTVASMSLKQKRGDYKFIQKFLKNKKMFGTFIIKILNLIPKRGKGRWDFLDKY